MLKLLRKLMSVGSPAPSRPVRPTAATSAVLARRAQPRVKPATEDVQFDPYNTGAFDRSASWERIGKRDY